MIARISLFFVLFNLMRISVFSQNLLSPEVVATSGGFSVSSSLQVSWTLGELATESFFTPTISLTQGFQQHSYSIEMENSINETEIYSDLKIYPNPFQYFFNIDINIKENANILLEMQKNGKINTNIPAFSNGFKTDFRPVKSAHEVEQETKQQEAKQEAEKRAKDHADREAISQLGVKIYTETLVIYTKDFFTKNQDLNTELIKEFETKYIKSVIGATLFERNPETAKMAFIQNKKEQLNLNSELIKIAESDGYLLSFDGEQWQAIKDNQEKLF